MRGKRYCKNLRLNKNKAACIQAMIALDSERSILPHNVALGFDSAFGLDVNLNEFLKSNFTLDLTEYSNGNLLLDDLMEGRYDRENPVLSLENGDLIADQIAAYVTVSRQIRKAFDIEINELLSINDLLPLTGDYHHPKTYYSPVFMGDSDDVYEGIHIQMALHNPIMPIGNTNIFAAENKTTEIKEVVATIFEYEEPVGYLSAALITVPDIAVFGQYESSHCLRSSDFKHDTALLHDIENYSPDLLSVAHALVSKAKAKLPNDQSQLSSLMRTFVLTDEGERKKAILFIKDVDISDAYKSLFSDIIETLGTVFADHGLYDSEAYGLVDGYNTLIWNSLSQSTDVSTKIEEINLGWKLGGLSAIVASQGYQWWHEALSSHKPFDNGDIEGAVILVEEICQSLLSIENESNAILSQGIEELLLQASVKEKSEDKITVH